MNDDTIYEQNPEVVARDLAANEGGVLLHLDSGAYFGVNPVGLLVWGLIDGHRTTAELVASLQDLIVDAPPQLAADVDSFLASALERKLIVVRG